MKKQLLRVTTRLVTLSVLLAAMGSEVGRAYTSYFDDLYACDTSYFSTLGDCRSNPSYPNGPTESQCRFNAGDSYTNCISSISSPMPLSNFCAQARMAVDSCAGLYAGEPQDPEAYSACRTATGIDQCQ